MAKKKITPIADRIVVIPDAAEDKTEGGIIIPEAFKDKQKKGHVVSVGPKVEEIEEGDNVLFGQFSGTELVIDKVEYRIMREEDVYAKF